jgi:16S rRNA (guanine966-N2)-methyltransferase
VREAVFARLQVEIAGARVLDLFAGSGALALEALSRGAAFALCVEVQRRLATRLQRQVAALELGAQVEVRAMSAAALVSEPAREPFDIVFFDPPYADSTAMVDALAPALSRGGWLGEGALLVYEFERAGRRASWPVAYRSERQKHYGQTGVEFLRYRVSPPSAS